MNEITADAIKTRARELGFDLVGITGAEPSAFAAEFRDWIDHGCAGEMGYLTRNVERRLDPRQLLPDARSIIVVGMNYYTEGEEAHTTTERYNKEHEAECSRAKTQRRKEERQETATEHHKAEVERCMTVIPCVGDELDRNQRAYIAPGAIRDPKPRLPEDVIQNEMAVFARYARGDDYHDVMTKRLRALLAFVKEQAGDGAEGRVYVDTGPILEREVARRAGLGWFGKNTMLINTRRGSYFFLGEIITNVSLELDSPAQGQCGTCTKCIDACPTGAITAPYQLDARRCLSYLTIELKGAIPEDLRPAIAASGNRIYGCDICQEVCPFNRPAASSSHPTPIPTTEPAFQSRPETTGRTLSELALLTEDEYRKQFKGSPVKRTKWRGLLRNVVAALSSSDDPEAEAALVEALDHGSPLEREQTAWSLNAIRSKEM